MPEWALDSLKIYGPLGLLVVSFYKGWIVPKMVYDREVSRADNAEKMLKEALALAGALERSLNP